LPENENDRAASDMKAFSFEQRRMGAECETVSQNECAGQNKTCHRMKMKMKDSFRYEVPWY
jgi:type VI protein secretion system component VasK